MSTRTASPSLSSNSPRRRQAAQLATVPRPPIARKDVAQLLSAKVGDHLAVHRLLLATFQGPTPAEFQAQLDEPGYHPSDRLIVKHLDQVAAHLRTSRRQIQFGALTIPAVRLLDLATAAEYRGRGFASSLIAAAEGRACEQGAWLGMTRTRAPALFARQGWSICGRHVFSTAGARQILAQLNATSEGIVTIAEEEARSLALSRHQPVSIRPLRRIELPAVIRLYERTLAERYGAPIRPAEYWDWLLARGACERVYVAVEGHESPERVAQPDAVRGAAFVQKSRLVELLVEPGRSDLAQHLVARVCADANEQDQWEVRFDAPPNDDLHRLFRSAGGQLHQAEEMGGEVFMAKVFSPLALLGGLGPVLTHRLREAGLHKALQFGLEVICAPGSKSTSTEQTARVRLAFEDETMQVAGLPMPRNYLSLRRRDLTPLLLGHWNVADLIDAGRMRASREGARDLARILFPKLPWWRPPLDDLLA